MRIPRTHLPGASSDALRGGSVFKAQTTKVCFFFFFYLPEKEKCWRCDECTHQSGSDAHKCCTKSAQKFVTVKCGFNNVTKEDLPEDQSSDYILFAFLMVLFYKLTRVVIEVVVSTSELKTPRLIKHDKPYHNLVPATTFPQPDLYPGLCRFKSTKPSFYPSF